MESKHHLSSRVITVEPMLFFLISIQGILINLRIQYLEYRIAKRYNYTIPNIGSADSSCLINGTKDAILKTIEAESSMWVLYLKDTSFFVPLLTATILSASSDYIGRKPIFIIASACHLIKSCIFLLVSVFELPLWLLIVAQAINGLGGDYAAPNSTALAYIVDIYPKKDRPFRFVIMSSVVYIGFGFSQVIIGQILQVTHDFQLSFACAVFLSLVNLVYVCCPFFIPESIETTGEIPNGMVKNLYLSYIRLFQKNSNSNKLKDKFHFMLVVTLICYTLYVIVNEAVYAVITIYGIAAPFCWTPVQAGIYAVMANMFPAICSIAAVKVMSRYLNNFWLIHISYISGVGQQLVVAFAKSPLVLLYASAAVGFLRTIAMAMYNAILSSLVDPDEQGVLFGCTALVYALAGLSSPLIFNTSYAVFVKQGQAQNTFFLAAAVLGGTMLLNGYLHIQSVNEERTKKSGDEEDSMPMINKDTECSSESE